MGRGEEGREEWPTGGLLPRRRHNWDLHPAYGTVPPNYQRAIPAARRFAGRAAVLSPAILAPPRPGFNAGNVPSWIAGMAKNLRRIRVPLTSSFALARTTKARRCVAPTREVICLRSETAALPLGGCIAFHSHPLKLCLRDGDSGLSFPEPADIKACERRLGINGTRLTRAPPRPNHLAGGWCHCKCRLPRDKIKAC